ncbi:MAG TPA: CYTH domain-containing protein [Reyranella sp.]|nr:CYTH domain-containing protein [Reyranella sp.]
MTPIYHSNIEIKARASRPIEELAHVCDKNGLRKEFCARQVDTYLNCPSGLLKIRTGQGPNPIIVHYSRTGTAAQLTSHWAAAVYQDCLTGELKEGVIASSLADVLVAALGVTSRVTKVRERWSNARVLVNLDRVEGLGQFVEIEILADRCSSSAEAEVLAGQWRSKLLVADKDLVGVSYSLLQQPP